MIGVVAGRRGGGVAAVAVAVGAAMAAVAMAMAAVAACDGGDGDRDWARVETGDLVIGVDVTGALRSVDSVMLGPPVVPTMWQFKIAHMASEGMTVKRGEPVLGFDATDLQQQLREKENERDAAAAELDKQRRSVEMARRDAQLKRAQVLADLGKAELKADVPEGLVSNVELEQAVLDLGLARRELAHLDERAVYVAQRDAAELGALEDKRRRADERVREIQGYIGKLSVPSPRDGTVIYVENWRGEKKKVGDNVWRVERVLEVVSLEEMKAEGDVDEVDASKIAADQRVSLRLDAHPDVELVGKVAAIADTVGRKSPDNPVKVAKVEIALDIGDGDGGPAIRMRPGMRFRGVIQTRRIEGAVLVPVDAVFLTAHGPVVYRRDGGDHDVVAVDIDGRSGDVVAVRGALSAGDEVSRVDLAGAR